MDTTSSDTTTATAASERLYIPPLGGVYASLDHLVEPLLRLGLAAVMIPKGLQKVFGMLGGGGLAGTADFFDTIGYSPGLLWGPLVGFTELIGGILLLVGLFVRPAAVAFVIFMLFALHFTWTSNGWFWLEGGAEFSWLIFLMAAVLAIRGAGAYSLDRRMGREF